MCLKLEGAGEGNGARFVFAKKSVTDHGKI